MSGNHREPQCEPQAEYFHERSRAKHAGPTDQVHLYHASDELDQRELGPLCNINQTTTIKDHPKSIDYQWVPYNPAESSLDLVQHNFLQNTCSNHSLPNGEINQASTQGNIALANLMQPTKAIESIIDCKNCITSSRDRKPFDKIALCNQCQCKWINFLPSPFNTHSDNGNVAHMLQHGHKHLPQELADSSSFGPNVHGYHRHRLIKIAFPKDKTNKECIGVLCRLHQGKVKVWVPALQMVEWLPAGTRRIKLMDSEEEKDAETVLRGSIPSIHDVELLFDEQNQQARGMSQRKRATSESPAQKRSFSAPHKNKELAQANTADSQPCIALPRTHRAYLTTGSFATRKTIHQLKDDSGFIPNPFGYAKNQPVQILDTKHGRSKSWYNGTLVEMRPGYVKVHYNQWPETYDEWLMAGSRRIRIADGVSAAVNDMSKSDEQLMAIAEDPDTQHNAKRKKQSLEKQQKGLKRTSSGYEQSGARTIASRRLAHLRAAEVEEFVPNLYGYSYMQHVNVLYHDKRYYEARIVGVQKNKVKVHYCGWTDDFDELIPNGSHRLQAIDTKECLEPDNLERDKHMPLAENTISNDEAVSVNVPQKIKALEATKLGINDQAVEKEEEGRQYVDLRQLFSFLPLFVDIIMVDDVLVEDKVEPDTAGVKCSHCKAAIEDFRYYCTYCEATSTTCNVNNLESFQLCLVCFGHCFPDWHPHPRSGFAIQAITDGPRQSQGSRPLSLSSSMWEEDVMETQDECMGEAAISLEASKIFTGVDNITAQDKHGYLFLEKWSNRKICGFCNDDDDNSQELGSFVGPFVSTMTKLGQEKKRTFWVHDACARYSPEVRFSVVDGKWYNVTRALKRGRSMRCFACKEKGATIGCFDSKCSKSFHLSCTNKPVNNFRNGVIFWCHIHEAALEKKDAYINVFHCDGCSKRFSNDETWLTCEQCSLDNYFSSFDLCKECYKKNSVLREHQHERSVYKETSYLQLEQAEVLEQIKKGDGKYTKKAQLFPWRSRKLSNGSTPTSCCYCGTLQADNWRKGYDGGILMCDTCFGMIYDRQQPTQDASEGSAAIENYIASIEDYSHKPYFTRETLSMNKSLIGSRLTSYGPQSNQLFSLTFDSTYFDIPGRAPRWATHSGTDYQGTWLPQTVRRALLRHTKKDERILSNFLGRGTDAIECFLLQRKCCGIDINPVAVALSQRNCCFEVPAGLTFAKHRPIIALTDARQLNGSLFGDESYHHILSHPPYKDCIAYSTHLEGDLSRFTQLEEFKKEYMRVVQESYRVLKMDRRLTLGIGDNREHCFYVPIGFHLIRLYIDQGFELEELIVKRQRYCSAYGLGTYLCVQFDFLIFTHEFIATFKKVPQQQVNKMPLMQEGLPTTNAPEYTTTLYGIPHSAIARNSRVMGTVWTFKPSHQYSFQILCISRMVNRFGQDDCNWLHVELAIDMTTQEHCQQQQDTESRADRLQITCNPSTMKVHPISEYEHKRQRKIQENRETLLKLGLISDLSQDSVVIDSIFCDTMLNKKPYPHADLVIMATGHIENLLPNQIDMYRKSIIQLAQDATRQLAVKGRLVIGTKDVRDQISGKLWPISMLVLEDIERTSHGLLKLKEMVITVPEGYAKDKNAFTAKPLIEEGNPAHLPIVHAIYLVFQK
ncbi:DNA methylase N-4 [Mucor ambiguus]|uniref:DNA methylase N-4 n=1 Tax=Mucor ambiguus TaxID=91626 RepID=A0A0C9MWJ7_9FUNG|nr:DNA methylase N-4 [Mucor ambiguus]